MQSLDMKTYNLVSTSIRSILNLANSIEDNKVLKSATIEIENILNSVQNEQSEKKTQNLKKEPLKEIKTLNNEIKEVYPSNVIKPLI